jgi:hypothetical protein
MLLDRARLARMVAHIDKPAFTYRSIEPSWFYTTLPRVLFSVGNVSSVCSSERVWVS